MNRPSPALDRPAAVLADTETGPHRLSPARDRDTPEGVTGPTGLGSIRPERAGEREESGNFRAALEAVRAEATSLRVDGKWIGILKGSLVIEGGTFAADENLGPRGIGRARIIGRVSRISAVRCYEDPPTS